MKNLLKITLIASVAAVAFNAPVSAGNHLAGLRGMQAPQLSHAEFENRFDKPESYTTQRQQRRSQAASPAYPSSYHSSNYAENNYNPHNEFEARFTQPKSHNTSWQERRLQRPATYAPSYGSAHRSAENNYPGQNFRQQFQKTKKSKYGNVYDYESGHCKTACAPQAPTYYNPVVQPKVTYYQITQYQCWDGTIVSDVNGCAAETHTVSIPQYRCWDGEVVTDVNGCKRRTITQEVTRMVDNTHQNYRPTPVNCPSGTTAQSDGTCMENTSAYNNPYTGSSIELFGDNPSSVPTPSYGYGSDNSFGLRSYLPKRK